MLSKLFKTQPKIKIDKITLQLKAMTVEETADFVFLFLPYIKLVKRIKEDYNGDSDPNTFSFVVGMLLQEMDRNELNRAFGILFHTTPEIMATLPFEKILLHIPNLIKLNKLYETFVIMRSLGAFS